MKEKTIDLVIRTSPKGDYPPFTEFTIPLNKNEDYHEYLVKFPLDPKEYDKYHIDEGDLTFSALFESDNLSEYGLNAISDFLAYMISISVYFRKNHSPLWPVIKPFIENISTTYKDNIDEMEDVSIIHSSLEPYELWVYLDYLLDDEETYLKILPDDLSSSPLYKPRPATREDYEREMFLRSQLDNLPKLKEELFYAYWKVI